MNTQEDEAINTLLEIAEPDAGENEVNTLFLHHVRSKELI